MKLFLIAMACAVVSSLMLGMSLGAQLAPSSKIIERLVPAETRGGWVKIDKRPGKLGHERVYCITVDSMLSCDWNDVRKIRPQNHIFE